MGVMRSLSRMSGDEKPKHYKMWGRLRQRLINELNEKEKAEKKDQASIDAFKFTLHVMAEIESSISL